MTLEQISDKLNEIDKKVEVLISRERPSENCRKYVELRASEAIRKSEDNKNEYQAIAKVHSEKFKTKIDTNVFWKLIGALFTLASGSYVFTWVIFNILGDK